jgi:hypothetical protein
MAKSGRQPTCGGYPSAPGLTPPGFASSSYQGSLFASSPASFELAQQMQLHQNFLNQAMLSGRVSPNRYQQLRNRLNQRQSLIQQQGLWPRLEQPQENPGGGESPPPP